MGCGLKKLPKLQRRRRTNRLDKWLQRFREGKPDWSIACHVRNPAPAAPAAVQVPVIARGVAARNPSRYDQPAVLLASTVACWFAGWPLTTWRPRNPQPPFPGSMASIPSWRHAPSRHHRPGASAAQDIGSPRDRTQTPRPAPVGNLSMSPSTTAQESRLADIQPDESGKVLAGAALASLLLLPLVRHLLPASPGPITAPATGPRRFARLCQRLGLRHLRTNPTTSTQRQDRALHPDRLAGMGLCADTGHPAIALGICRSGCINTTGTDLTSLQYQPHLPRHHLLEQPGGFTARAPSSARLGVSIWTRTGDDF